MRFSTLPIRCRRHGPPVLAALLGGLLYAVWRPPSTDLATQRFRSTLFGRSGFSVWDNQWFGGHHLPGYSLLAPVGGWLIGPELLGIVATVGVALGASVLCHRLAGRDSSLASPTGAAVLLTLGALASLYGGRIAFLLGTAFGVAALVASLQSHPTRTPVVTAALALCCAMSSPVAGMFVAIIGCATALSGAVPRRTALALTVPPLVLVGSLWVLFPDGGDFPFPLGGAINAVLVAGVVAVAGWRFISLRWACLGYVGLCLIVLAIDTPIGGNAARLGALAGPPLLALLIQRRALVAVLLVPLIALQWSPISLALTGDRAQTESAFYTPLLDTLALLPQPLRVEVVPVASHDESNFVALQYPIARGWHRQLDRKYNPLFFADQLDAETYRQWLVDNGVSVVAIATTKLDSAGTLERTLLAHPPSYLVPLATGGVWRVFQVVPAPVLADHGATLTSIGVGSFTLEVPSPKATPEPITVKIRFSPYFRVTHGDACVFEAADGWTNVVASTPGRVTVRASLSLRALFDRDGDC